MISRMKALTSKSHLHQLSQNRIRWGFYLDDLGDLDGNQLQIPTMCTGIAIPHNDSGSILERGYQIWGEIIL